MDGKYMKYTKVKVKSIWEGFYSLVVFGAIFYTALQNSMAKYVMSLPNYVNWFFIFCCGVLCLTKRYKKSELQEYFILVIGVFTGLISYYLCGSKVLVETLLFSLAAKDFNPKKVIRTYKWSLLIAILGVFILNQLGIFPDTTYYKNGEIRYTFGFTHPNVFAFFILALICCYYFEYRSALRPVDAVPCLIGFILTFVFSKSETVSVILFCLLLIIIFSSIRKIYLFFERNQKLFRRMIAVGIVAGILTVILIASELSSMSFLTNLGNTAAARLYYANRGLDMYGVHLFGQKIQTYNSLESANSNYFMIDCLYVQLLVRDGIIVSFFFWGMLIRSFMKMVKNRYILAGLIIMLLLIYSIMETGLAFLCFSFIFAMQFTSYDDVNQTESVLLSA